MKERDFQKKLIDDLKTLFPGCVVMKNDPGYIQGIPDLIVLYNEQWAALECKRSADAHHQPNQEYYVNKLDQMSFARFVYPENKEQVLYDLQKAFNS